MKKSSHKRKMLIKELMIIIGLLIVIVTSLLVDCAILHIPNFLILSIEDVENLFFTLFAVQASVSTVSIAIVSIINGLVNEYVLGISISRFIMNLKPRLLKHNRLIIVNLILCALNYFCLSYCLFNACIAWFVASVIITILMVKEIYIIFMGKNFIRKEIYEYVYENYNSVILKDLNIELTTAIETGNSLVVQEDFNAIKNIFECETKKSNYQQTEIIEQLSTIICDAFEKTTHKHNGTKNNQFILLICDIYKIANKPEETPLHLSIWDKIYVDFFRALKDISYEQLREYFAYYTLHHELYKNLRGRPFKEIQNSSLKYYAYWTYSIFSEENSQLSKSELIEETKSIYEMVSISLYYGSDFENEIAIKELMTMEICNLHKVMIDNGDAVSLKKNFFHLMRYDIDKPEQAIVYIITLIYLYYLSAREELVKEKPVQENANKIIEENHSSIQYFYLHLDLINIVKTKLSFIKKMLQNWEHMKELEAKTMIMDDVLDDFFVFSVLGKFWQKDIISDMIKELVPESMFYIYQRYFSKDDGKLLSSLYFEFEKIFNKEKDNSVIMDNISLLQDVFNERYKSEIIKEGQLKKISEEQKSDFETAVKNRIKKIVDTELRPFSFKEIDSYENAINKDNTIVYAAVISNYFFKQKELEKNVEDSLFTHTIFAFIRSILPNIDYNIIFNDNKHKQQILIDAIQKLQINPSVAIGNRDDFWGDDEEKDILKKFTETMKRIRYPEGYNHYFILDEKLIEFSLENIRVEFTDLPWENIKHRCKEGEDGSLKFNVTNNIYLPFTKSEIEEYITNTEKKVLVYADIKIRLGSEKVGAGIEITSK